MFKINDIDVGSNDIVESYLALPRPNLMHTNKALLSEMAHCHMS
jgi:hypothetical protein